MWLKAKQSKYKHFYKNGKAICGSPAVAYSELDWHKQIERAPKCPLCLRLTTAGADAEQPRSSA